VRKLTHFIAEAGSNHNGSIKRATELIDVAENAGADSVKFQFIFADGLYLPAYFDGKEYVENPVYKVRRSEEFSRSEWETIWAYAKSKNIIVSASVFDIRGVELLSDLGAPYVKIASTDLTNHELIGMACESFNKVIISTGMSSLAEVDEAYQFVCRNFPSIELELMHCVSVYPCPLEDANIQRIKVLSNAFNCPIGYSDHTEGVASAAQAIALGATFFEKHFTVDTSLPGFDHRYALDADQLVEYVDTLRRCSEGLARQINYSNHAEEVTKIRARRGIYAATDLPVGHVLCRNDLLYVRPSTDQAFADPAELVGSILSDSIKRYEPIRLSNSVAALGQSSWQVAQDFWLQEMTNKGMPS